MIHLGDRQDIFFLMCSPSLSKQSAARLLASPTPPSIRFLLFIFQFCYGIHFSRLVVDNIAALNQSLLQIQCSCRRTFRGEEVKKGRASGHYWQCTLPCCLTLYIYKSFGEWKELRLNLWAVQLNFSDAVTICLDCNGFMNRPDSDCWWWLNDEPFLFCQSLVIPTGRRWSQASNPLLFLAVITRPSSNF